MAGNGCNKWFDCLDSSCPCFGSKVYCEEDHCLCSCQTCFNRLRHETVVQKMHRKSTESANNGCNKWFDCLDPSCPCFGAKVYCEEDHCLCSCQNCFNRLRHETVVQKMRLKSESTNNPEPLKDDDDDKDDDNEDETVVVPSEPDEPEEVDDAVEVEPRHNQIDIAPIQQEEPLEDDDKDDDYEVELVVVPFQRDEHEEEDDAVEVEPRHNQIAVAPLVQEEPVVNCNCKAGCTTARYCPCLQNNAACTDSCNCGVQCANPRGTRSVMRCTCYKSECNAFSCNCFNMDRGCWEECKCCEDVCENPKGKKKRGSCHASWELVYRLVKEENTNRASRLYCRDLLARKCIRITPLRGKF